MDMKEKLVELLDNFHRDLSPFAGNDKLFMVDDNIEQAEYLIAHGVTVQEWISVKERLPEENGYYLCVVCVSSVNQRNEYRRMILFWEDNVWIDMANSFRTKKPLYWMPLPEPPKGE